VGAIADLFFQQVTGIEAWPLPRARLHRAHPLLCVVQTATRILVIEHEQRVLIGIGVAQEVIGLLLDVARPEEVIGTPQHATSACLLSRALIGWVDVVDILSAFVNAAPNAGGLSRREVVPAAVVMAQVDNPAMNLHGPISVQLTSMPSSGTGMLLS